MKPGLEKRGSGSGQFGEQKQPSTRVVCVPRVAHVLQVIDIPNSMTVLPELIPYSIEMVGSNACTGGIGPEQLSNRPASSTLPAQHLIAVCVCSAHLVTYTACTLLAGGGSEPSLC